MIPVVFAVDDNFADLELLKLAFEECGFQVDFVTASDGLGAIRQLGTIMPDLVLLDIKMPGVDGFEVLRWLGGQERLRHIPVIMMSSSSAASEQQKAKDLGAVRFWSKPPRFDEVVTFTGSLKGLLNIS